MHTSRGKSIAQAHTNSKGNKFRAIFQHTFHKREGNHMKIPENAKGLSMCATYSQIKKQNTPQKWSNIWCAQNIVVVASATAARAFLYDKCCLVVVCGGRWKIFENKTERPAHGTVKSDPDPLCKHGGHKTLRYAKFMKIPHQATLDAVEIPLPKEFFHHVVREKCAF